MPKIYLDSPVGILEITGSQDMIHSVLFIDKQVEEASEPTSPLLENCKEQLQQYFDGALRVFDFPFRQEGSSFHQRVWNELCNIPYGNTTSYIAIARKIGDDKVVRAVGTANGRNNMAIVVPCHRVIGSNGTLTGYAGGLWRKQWLLEHEAKVAHGIVRLF